MKTVDKYSVIFLTSLDIQIIARSRLVVKNASWNSALLRNFSHTDKRFMWSSSAIIVTKHTAPSSTCSDISRPNMSLAELVELVDQPDENEKIMSNLA